MIDVSSKIRVKSSQRHTLDNDSIVGFESHVGQMS